MDEEVLVPHCVFTSTPARVLEFVDQGRAEHGRVCQARGLVKALRGPELSAVDDLMNCFERIDEGTADERVCRTGRARGLATGLLTSEQTSLALLAKLLEDLGL